jgi:hypothetical protein
MTPSTLTGIVSRTRLIEPEEELLAEKRGEEEGVWSIQAAPLPFVKQTRVNGYEGQK